MTIMRYDHEKEEEDEDDDDNGYLQTSLCHRDGRLNGM